MSEGIVAGVAAVKTASTKLPVVDMAALRTVAVALNPVIPLIIVAEKFGPLPPT
jgi:hypothetical protein